MRHSGESPKILGCRSFFFGVLAVALAAACQDSQMDPMIMSPPAQPPAQPPGPPGPPPTQPPDHSPVTVTFLRHDNPNYRIADNAFFADYKAKNPHVTIVDTTVDFRTLASALNGDLKTDQFMYDFVLVPPGRLCSYANNVLDVPPDVITMDDAHKDFFAAPLEGSICGGKLKGLPVEYNLEYGGVIVNMDKYQAKFPGKTPNWTDWNTFLTEAAALSEFDGADAQMANGLDIDPGWSPPTRHIFFGMILQREGRYHSLSGDGTFDLDTQEARDSLTTMVEWVTKHRIMSPALIPDKNTGVTARLAAGATGYGWSDPAKPLSVMGYVGTWGVPSTVSQRAPDTQWRYEFHALPPMVGTKHKFVTDSGWSFAVPRTSKHPAAAWDIIKSLALSPAAMKKWSSVTGALPALKANGTQEAAAGDLALARVQPLLEHGHWRGYIPAQAIDVANATFVTNFFAVVRGLKTVPEALQSMQNTANMAIAQYR